MKKTFVDVMLELPVDATLRDFLTTHSLPVPDGFAWDDTPETSQFLVEAVKVWPDIAARDRMTANLMASVQLGDAAGKQAMFEAAVTDGAALAGLTLCASDVHRSFWLYVHHPALFERAYDFSFWEQHGQQTQQYDLGLKRQPNGSDANLTALRHAISAFYKRELQCGDGSVAHLVERSPGVFLLSVHVKDMAMLRLEFEGATLKRRVGNPNIHMVLEYAKSTGVVRTLVRGGAKYQQMLVEAFAEHVLGVKASAHKIKSPTLDLSMLRTGFDVPEVFEPRLGEVRAQPAFLDVLHQPVAHTQIAGHILERHRLAQLQDKPLETAGVRPPGIGERNGNHRLRLTITTFNPGNLGKHGHRLVTNRHRRPALGNRPPPDDVRPAAVRTGQFTAIVPHPHHQPPVLFLNRLMFVAANPQRPVEYTRGHAGLPDRMVVVQPPIKPASPHFTTVRS